MRCGGGLRRSSLAPRVQLVEEEEEVEEVEDESSQLRILWREKHE